MTPRDLDTADVVQIPLCEIELGWRRRAQHGDLKALGRSIMERGLIHPIVVSRQRDGTYQLVAGERRLLAVQQALGWKEIPARVVELEDGDQLRAIELEENTERVELTPYERNKARLQEWREEAARAAAASPRRKSPAPAGSASGGDSSVAPEAKPAVPAEAPGAPTTSEPGVSATAVSETPAAAKLGRPRAATSSRSLADTAGVSRATVAKGVLYEQAGERYPILKMPWWSQRAAIEAAALLDEMPAAVRPGVVAILRRLMDESPDEPDTPRAVTVLRGMLDLPPHHLHASTSLILTGTDEQKLQAYRTATEGIPTADQRIAMIERALEALGRAAGLRDDDFTAELKELAKKARRDYRVVLDQLKGESIARRSVA